MKSRVCFVVIVVCIGIFGSVIHATGQLSYAQLKPLVIEANEKLNAGKIDDAINLLATAVSDTDDRLVTLPSGHDVSAIQVLGVAYWGKRDAVNTLRYLQPVAYRIPVDENNGIPRVVLACRNILSSQGKLQSVDVSTLINDTSFARTLISVDGTAYTSMNRIVLAIGGVCRKSGKALILSVGRISIEVAISGDKLSNKKRQSGIMRVSGVLRNGEVMVPVRDLTKALGGTLRWDHKLKLILARIPYAGSKTHAT